MAQIWDDIADAPNNVTMSNNQSVLRFRWNFITFSGETQVEAALRYRKVNAYGDGTPLSIRDRMRRDEAQWTNASTTIINRLEDRTTWVLSGGELVPPAENLRRYSYTYHVDYPINNFSEGLWIFQAGLRRVADSSGVINNVEAWTAHRVEISDFADQQIFAGASTSAVKGPNFENEGVYAVKVEAMSAAGITAESSEQQFNVWDSNKYYYDGGTVRPYPEYQKVGTQTGRITRPS